MVCDVSYLFGVIVYRLEEGLLLFRVSFVITRGEFFWDFSAMGTLGKNCNL